MATDCLRDDFYLWDSGSAASIQYRFPNAGLPVSNVPDRRFHRTGIFMTAIFDGIVLRLGLSVLFGIVLDMKYLGFWMGDALANFTPLWVGIIFYRSGAWKKRAV